MRLPAIRSERRPRPAAVTVTWPPLPLRDHIRTVCIAPALSGKSPYLGAATMGQETCSDIGN